MENCFFFLLHCILHVNVFIFNKTENQTKKKKYVKYSLKKKKTKLTEIILYKVCNRSNDGSYVDCKNRNAKISSNTCCIGKVSRRCAVVYVQLNDVYV